MTSKELSEIYTVVEQNLKVMNHPNTPENRLQALHDLKKVYEQHCRTVEDDLYHVILANELDRLEGR